MEWIKIKVKHFDYDMADASDIVYKMWISAMIYTAIIEKMPTPEQLDRRLGRENHKNLVKYLQKTGVELDYVLGKILEDVAAIKHRRDHSKAYMLAQRGGQQVVRHDAKIREDKIREDKTPKPTLQVTTDEKPKSIPRKHFKDLGRPDPKEQEAVAAMIARDKAKL